jgi:small conductance mechanosensitive channel
MNLNLQDLLQKAAELGIEFGPKLLLAILTFVVGIWLIKKVTRIVERSTQKQDLDPSLSTFLSSLIRILLYALLLISVGSMIGIETTSFIAMLGAAGLAVGLALQGSLANFAGGVLILFFRPFKVGHLIESQGYLGHVQAIKILSTTIKTLDNKLVILPNGPVANNPVANFTELGVLRVDLVVGVSYHADLRKAKEVILETLKKDPLVLKDPAPVVAVTELNSSSVDFVVRPYATPETYWDVYFNSLENVKLALDAAGIEIPFPQRVITFQNALPTS